MTGTPGAAVVSMARLFAYLHITGSGNVHLRVRQPPGVIANQRMDALKDALHRVGSPAYWYGDKWEWDYPLTAAAVVSLQRVAAEYGLDIEYAPDLEKFALEQKGIEEYEKNTRLAIEKIIRDGDLVPDYITNTMGGEKPPLRHQRISYHWGVRVTGLLLAHDPGCIAGDAIIKINRHGKVYATTLRDLYRKFNKIDPSWKKDGVTTCKSLMPDRILKHNQIMAVLDKGVKPCVKVTLQSGKYIICTPDHEIITFFGDKQAQHLNPGECVLTNGTQVCRDCGSPDNLITYQYAKYKGLCRSCAHRGTKNGRWKTGVQIDKDGYVLISGQYTHPRRNKDNSVRQHVLVMEQHLGRFLTENECVHHINEDKGDNRLENLQLLTISEHHRLHGIESKYASMNGGKTGTGGDIIFIPNRDYVVSVEDAGTTDVYDIVMADPGRNFVANGILVHNCGKTRSAVDMSRGWYDSGVVRFMTQHWLPNQKRWGVHGGVLIVCPNHLQRTWKNEMALWQGMTALELQGGREKKRRLAGTVAHAHIINYESLQIVEENKYDALIIDESHRCANSSQQTHRTLELAQHARRRLGLTGTPVSNNLESVFFQALIIDGGRSLGASKTAFMERWFVSEVVGKGAVQYVPKPGASDEIAKLMARFTYFVRKEDALDLPPKIHSQIPIEMTEDQARYYQSLKEEAITYIQDSTVTVEQAAARMMKLRQVCQGFVLDDTGTVRDFTSAKIDALLDLLQNTLSGRKVVVWATFTHEINRLCATMAQRGIGYVRLDGQVTGKEARNQALKLWNTHPQIQVFIGQIQMGIGITLHANECQVPCYDCIYLGLDWSYINWVQSQDRIHRIGQKYACTYRYFLMEGGIDHQIYKALQTKANTANAVYRTGKEFFRSLLTGDIPALGAIE